jgi:hypothetical protein
MASWWSVLTRTKPLLHILSFLTMWVFVVVLLAVEQNQTVMLHLDQVHTYQLQKQPLNYDGITRPAINTLFQTQWTIPTDDVGCFALTNWTGNTACANKRTTLVTSTRQLMSCDALRSPGCNCLNQVLSKIANDLSAVGVNNNSFTGVFASVGKNLTGLQPNILASIEACRFLHHPPYLAAETNTGNTLVRRVGLLFLLSTMLTGNAVLCFWFPPGAREWTVALWRILGIVVWPIVGAMVPAIIETAASNLIMLIVLPPLVLLLWCVRPPARAPRPPALTRAPPPRRYELVLSSHHKPFYFHPYFFAVLLATASTIALVENNVFDYDNITYEIWKSHMVSCLYFAVYWFHGKAYEVDATSSFFTSHAQQETVFLALVMATVSVLSTAMAPYTSVAYTNYLLWIPLQLAVAAFMDVIYVSQQDRLHKQPKQDAWWYVPEGVYLISGIALVLKALVVIYYWRDYSMIYHLQFENVPTRSIQYNSSYAWLTPTY